MRRAMIAGAAAGAAAYSAPALAFVGPGRRLLGICDRVDDAHGISLTFDDGPHPQGTPAVLDVLDRLSARATFFLSGEQVDRYPQLAREIAERGHGIGVHGYRHRLLPTVGPRRCVADLRRAHAAVAAAAGVEPRLYRPPYGVFTVAALFAAKRLGCVPVLWSAWGRDWQAGATAASICGVVSRGLTAGGIVLLHDADHYSAPGSWRATAAALPDLVGGARARGLAPIPLEPALVC